MRAAEARISILLLGAIGIVVGATYWLAMANTPTNVWGLLRGALVIGGAASCVALGIAALLRDMRVYHRRVLDQARDWVLAAGPGMGHAPKDPNLKPFIMPLRERIAELSSQAETLQVQKKNLEIQLRVADAQRRQSQIMIHGISDAVLITDAFDELLQANEAAGELFNFDVNAVVRKPVAQLLGDKAGARL